MDATDASHYHSAYDVDFSKANPKPKPAEYTYLIRNTAVYEWDYPRQMLEIRLLEARGEAKTAATRSTS